MSKGKAIFKAVCDAPDLGAALAALPPKHWVSLYSYLLQSYGETGVSGEVLGMVLVDAGRRYSEAWTKEAKRKSIL